VASSRLTTVESTLPQFYFHTDTLTRTNDNEGVNLPGALEARRQAIATCGEMMKDSPEAFWGSRPWSVTVTDTVGLILWELSMDGTASAAAPT